MIAFPVSEGWTGAGGVPERSVQAAGELGAVGHDDDLVSYAGLDEFELDGFDASVIHVRGRHAMCAGLRVGERNVTDTVDGKGVVQTAVVAEDTTMTMGSIFTQTDIGDDEEGREFGAEETDGLDDRAIRVIGGRTKGVFGVGSGGYTKENDGAETLTDQGGEMGDEFVKATAVLIG